MSWRARLSVVLHQVRVPENLGAVARVMANFELSTLVLADPLTYAVRDAERTAIRASKVLDGMRMTATLSEALAPSVFAIGTTSRKVEGRPSRTPEEGASLLARNAARGPVALVLGGEKRGLSDAELTLCQEVVAIPTGATQPSMNLAQAAAVLLYTCAREPEPGEPSAPTGEPVPEGASAALVDALRGRMRTVLSRRGFLNPQAPDHVLAELLRTLTRGAPSRREIEMWLTAFKKLDRTRNEE